MCDAVAPVESCDESPHFHEYDAIDPSASVDPEPFTDRVRSDAAVVKLATGAWFGAGAVTVTVFVTACVAPSSSVTVRVTCLSPADA